MRTFPWDSDDELVTLTSGDLIAVLDRFLRRSLTREEVEQWAEAIESREDIGYEVPYQDQLKQAIFELANPDLTGQLVPESATRLKAILTRP